MVYLILKTEALELLATLAQHASDFDPEKTDTDNEAPNNG